MALLNISLTIPNSISIGPAADTSTLDIDKTIQCIADEEEIIDIQVSNDSGTTWIDVHRFFGTGTVNVSIYAQSIRANVINADYRSLPSIEITSNSIPSTLTVASTTIPPIAPSSSVDTSNMSASKTIYCSGAENEIIDVQMSNNLSDPNSWVSLFKLDAGNYQHLDLYAQKIRAVPVVADYRATAIIVIAAAGIVAGSDNAGHGGGSGDSGTTNYTPDDNGDWSPTPANVAAALDQLAARPNAGDPTMGGDIMGTALTSKLIALDGIPLPAASTVEAKKVLEALGENLWNAAASICYDGQYLWVSDAAWGGDQDHRARAIRIIDPSNVVASAVTTLDLTSFGTFAVRTVKMSQDNTMIFASALDYQNDNDGACFIIDKATQQVIGRAFVANGVGARDACDDGAGNLWVVARNGVGVEKFIISDVIFNGPGTPTSPAQTINIPNGVEEICFAGGYVWVDAGGNNILTRVDPSGNVDTYTDPDGYSIWGPVYLFGSIWTGTNNGNILRFDPTQFGGAFRTGVIDTPGRNIKSAFASDGTFLWAADYNHAGNNKLLKINPSALIFVTPITTVGNSGIWSLAYAGGNKLFGARRNQNPSDIVKMDVNLNTFTAYPLSTFVIQYSSIDNLQGYNISASQPSNGQVLTWDDGDQVWYPNTSGGSSFTDGSGNLVLNGGNYLYLDGNGDTNWRIGRNIATYPKLLASSSSTDILYSNTPNEGVTIGPNDNSGSTFEINGDRNAYFAGKIGIGVIPDTLGSLILQTPTNGSNDVVFAIHSAVGGQGCFIGIIGTDGSYVSTGHTDDIFIRSQSDKILIANGTDGQETARFVGSGSSTNAALQLTNGTNSNVSDANTGRIRYSIAHQKLEISENGGAYTSLSGGGISGSITNHQIAFGDDTSITGSNGFTYDGSDVKLSSGNFGIDDGHYINFAGTDTFWHMGRNVATSSGSHNYTKTLVLSNSIDILLPGDGEGFTIGAQAATSLFEVLDDGKVYVSNKLGIGVAPSSRALEVNGNANITGGLFVAAGTSNEVEIVSNQIRFSNSGGVDTQNPSDVLYIGSQAGSIRVGNPANITSPPSVPCDIELRGNVTAYNGTFDIAGVQIDPSAATVGQVLVYNGIKFVAANNVPATKPYVLATGSSASPDINGDDHLKFGDTPWNSGSPDISVDISTTYTTTSNVASIGRFTLAGGKTYKLVANAGYVDTGSVIYQWYDATHNNYMGTAGWSPGSGGTGGDAVAYTGPFSTVLVELRFRSVIGSPTVVGSNPVYAWATVEEI